MDSCKNKPKNTCGDRKSNARCVFYDIDVPSYSKLDEEDCITIEETTEDLYKLVSWIRQSIGTSNFDAECLEIEKVPDTYVKNNNRFLLVDIVKELVKKQCTESESTNNDINNVLANLDYKCLVDECGVKPGNLKDFFQLLINYTCTNT